MLAAQLDWVSQPVPSGEAEGVTFCLEGTQSCHSRELRPGAITTLYPGGLGGGRVGKAGRVPSSKHLQMSTFYSWVTEAESFKSELGAPGRGKAKREDNSLDFTHCALLHLRAPQVKFSRTLMPSSAQAAKLNRAGFVSSSTSDPLRWQAASLLLPILPGTRF